MPPARVKRGRGRRAARIVHAYGGRKGKEERIDRRANGLYRAARSQRPEGCKFQEFLPKRPIFRAFASEGKDAEQLITSRVCRADASYTPSTLIALVLLSSDSRTYERRCEARRDKAFVSPLSICLEPRVMKSSAARG